MKIPLTFVLAAFIAATFARGAGSLTVTATYELATARPSEIITVPWSEIRQRLPDAAPDKLVIKDSKGRVLIHQFTNFQPGDKAGRYDDVLFQYSFAAESISTPSAPAAVAAAPASGMAPSCTFPTIGRRGG